MALAWLKLLRDGEIGKLNAATSFPFSYRTTNRMKHCEQDSMSAAEVPSFVECLRKNESLLLKELQYAPDLRATVATKHEASNSLKPLLDDLAQDETLITTFANGDGVTFLFALVLRREGDDMRVRVLAINAEFPE